MTKEEAVKRLKCIQAANDGAFNDSVAEGLRADEPYALGETMTFREFFEADHEALDMAIKALEAEPTKEERRLLEKWRDNRGVSMKDFEEAMNTLETESNDEKVTLQFSKGALKARMGKYVVYDVEWLKEHFYTTEAKIYGEPAPIVHESEKGADCRKGKWKRISPAKIYECSKCGGNVMTDDIDSYNFCQHCGADMKGGEEDE